MLSKGGIYRTNMVLSLLPRRINYISYHDEMSMEVWKEVEQLIMIGNLSKRRSLEEAFNKHFLV
jgi:hypothetical protein